MVVSSLAFFIALPLLVLKNFGGPILIVMLVLARRTNRDEHEELLVVVTVVLTVDLISVFYWEPISHHISQSLSVMRNALRGFASK